jgi:hypothetical protein
MTVIDLRRRTHPRNCHNYLDSCLFDRDDDNDANRVLALRNSGMVSFVIAKSVKDEVDHPNTPPEAKAKASGMLFTFPVRPSADEERKRLLVEKIIIGNGKPATYLPDASHVLEAGLHHGYFITNDDRILGKKGKLKEACGVRIVSPIEWLTLYEAAFQP